MPRVNAWERKKVGWPTNFFMFVFSCDTPEDLDEIIFIPKAEWEDAVKEALNLLPEHIRSLFVAHFQKGISMSDIGRAQSVTGECIRLKMKTVRDKRLSFPPISDYLRYGRHECKVNPKSYLDLDLSPRVRDKLEHGGIKSIFDIGLVLQGVSPAQLRNFGEKAYLELREKVKAVGIEVYIEDEDFALKEAVKSPSQRWPWDFLNFVFYRQNMMHLPADWYPSLNYCVSHLSDQDQAVVKARFVRHKSNVEIGQELNISKDAVAKAMSRVKKTMLSEPLCSYLRFGIIGSPGEYKKSSSHN